jgi:hypothetical protein
MPKKPDPITLRNKLTKRYIESGNKPDAARKKAVEQLKGYDRRQANKG